MSLPYTDAGSSLAAIHEMLRDYFDGLYFSDTQRLRRAFHPEAHYVCVTTGELQYLRMDEYFPVVDNRESPASRGEMRQDRVISIEFAGPTTALARVECAIGEKHFSDLLTLVFLTERWQIISKAFHYEIVKE